MGEGQQVFFAGVDLPTQGRQQVVRRGRGEFHHLRAPGRHDGPDAHDAPLVAQRLDFEARLHGASRFARGGDDAHDAFEAARHGQGHGAIQRARILGQILRDGDMEGETRQACCQRRAMRDEQGLVLVFDAPARDAMSSVLGTGSGEQARKLRGVESLAHFGDGEAQIARRELRLASAAALAEGARHHGRVGRPAPQVAFQQGLDEVGDLLRQLVAPGAARREVVQLRKPRVKDAWIGFLGGPAARQHRAECEQVHRRPRVILLDDLGRHAKGRAERRTHARTRGLDEAIVRQLDAPVAVDEQVARGHVPVQQAAPVQVREGVARGRRHGADFRDAAGSQGQPSPVLESLGPLAGVPHPPIRKDTMVKQAQEIRMLERSQRRQLRHAGSGSQAVQLTGTLHLPDLAGGVLRELAQRLVAEFCDPIHVVQILEFDCLRNQS
jgi:hypothetical protein